MILSKVPINAGVLYFLHNAHIQRFPSISTTEIQLITLDCVRFTILCRKRIVQSRTSIERRFKGIKTHDLSAFQKQARLRFILTLYVPCIVTNYINKPTRCTFCMYLFYNVFYTTLHVPNNHSFHHQEFMIYCICSSVQTMQTCLDALHGLYSWFVYIIRFFLWDNERENPRIPPKVLQKFKNSRLSC